MWEKETADAIAVLANLATLVGLPLALIALSVAAWQVILSRRATTASAVIALNESFRQAWHVFTKAANDDDRQHAFADIMNLLETTCSIFEDGSLVGKTGTLLEDYLCHVFTLIQSSDDARQRIQAMFNTRTTFDHCIRFLAQHRTKIGNLYVPDPANSGEANQAPIT